MEKAELRPLLRHQLKSVAVAELAAANQMIVERLKREVDWRVVDKLCVYDPVEAWREPGMAHLVSWLRERHSQVKVTVLSQTNNTDFPSESFDIIIVPLLGFDDRCIRLGRGSGWYDRFLAKQPNARKIGVALEIQHVSHLPVEPHDIALDMIVTDQASYRKHE